MDSETPRRDARQWERQARRGARLVVPEVHFKKLTRKLGKRLMPSHRFAQRATARRLLHIAFERFERDVAGVALSLALFRGRVGVTAGDLLMAAMIKYPQYLPEREELDRYIRYHDIVFNQTAIELERRKKNREKKLLY